MYVSLVRLQVLVDIMGWEGNYTSCSEFMCLFYLYLHYLSVFFGLFQHTQYDRHNFLLVTD